MTATAGFSSEWCACPPLATSPSRNKLVHRLRCAFPGWLSFRDGATPVDPPTQLPSPKQLHKVTFIKLQLPPEIRLGNDVSSLPAFHACIKEQRRRLHKDETRTMTYAYACSIPFFRLLATAMTTPAETILISRCHPVTLMSECCLAARGSKGVSFARERPNLRLPK